MSNLLPPNATPQERALDSTVARLGDVPAPLRSLWNADTCPADLLPWLAWALGVVNWKPYWPENVKRATIRTAVEIASRRGTRAVVQQVVQNFGANLVLREWFETGGSGNPYTFDVIINYGQGDYVSEQFQQDIIQELNRAKPARAHFTVGTGIQARAELGIAALARVATYTRLNMVA